MWRGIAQPGPESGPSFVNLEVKVVKPFQVVPVLLDSGAHSTQGPSWGHFKSLFTRELVNFWQEMTTKWLQERQDGSTNDKEMPPRRVTRGTFPQTSIFVNVF